MLYTFIGKHFSDYHVFQEVKRVILNDLKSVGKKSGLNSFEQVRSLLTN